MISQLQKHAILETILGASVIMTYSIIGHSAKTPTEAAKTYE
jgi:hypothetical protein